MPAVLSLGIAHGASPVSRCTCPPGIHRNLPPLFILSQCLQGFFTRTLQLCGQHRIEAQQSNFLQNKFSFLQNSVNLQGQLLAKQAKSAVSTFPESFVPIQEHSLVRTFRSLAHAAACSWFGICTTFTASAQKALSTACCTSCKKREILHRRVRKYRSKIQPICITFFCSPHPQSQAEKGFHPKDSRS